MARPSITVVNAKNPSWANANHTAILLDVKFAEYPDYVAFLAVLTDPEPHGRTIFANASAGAYGSVAPFQAPSPAAVLAAKQSELTSKIDRIAENIRGTYITLGSGQAMIYQEKGEEAVALQSDQNPDPANYPMLAATVGIEGANIQQVAALVLATKAAWRTVGAAIEGARIRGKAAVNAATTVDAAQDAFNEIEWPPRYGS